MNSRPPILVVIGYMTTSRSGGNARCPHQIAVNVDHRQTQRSSNISDPELFAANIRFLLHNDVSRPRSASHQSPLQPVDRSNVPVFDSTLATIKCKSGGAAK